jgi:hypothetical protein
MHDGHRSQFSRLSVGQSGEKKPFEFLVGHDRYLSELRDHGDVGAEVSGFPRQRILVKPSLRSVARRLAAMPRPREPMG